MTTELAKLDVELAPVEVKDLASYEKLREHLKEEQRLLDILQQQAEATRKRKIAPHLPQLSPGILSDSKASIFELPLLSVQWW